MDRDRDELSGEGLLQVERLGVGDVAALMSLERLCFAYHWSEDQVRLGLERGAFHVLGIRLGGALAGYLAYSTICDEMEILNLAVHPDRRRRGLARALMAAMLRDCRERGVARGFLDVKVSNLSAIDLYRKFGFKQCGVRKKYYPDTKEDALLFALDIAANGQDAPEPGVRHA